MRSKAAMADAFRRFRSFRRASVPHPILRVSGVLVMLVLGAAFAIHAEVARAARLCIEWGLGGDCEGYTQVQGSEGYRTSGDPCLELPPCENGGTNSTWTISSSSTDPYVNVGPLPLNGELYFWLECRGEYGFAGAELTLGGDLVPVSAEPLIDTLYFAFIHRPWGLVLNVQPSDCIMSTPVAVARVTVEEQAVGVDERTSGQPWGRIKALYR